MRYQLIHLNLRADLIHTANIKWWQDVNTGQPIQRNKWELIALVISELSEALEGERKNLMDDKLPHRKMAEVEMADAYIRLLDYSAGFAVRIQGWKLLDPIPQNKAEAIFLMMEMAVHIPSAHTSAFISLVLAMIEEYCDKFNYDLWGAFEEKMEFNAKREDHTHEARRIAGGKQF